MRIARASWLGRGPLGRSALLGFLVACPCLACDESSSSTSQTTSAARVPAHPRGKGIEGTERRHVIVMIGDGMQLAHEVAASRYLFGEDMALSFHSLPTSAYVTTWDVTGYAQRAALLGKPPYAPDTFEPSVGYDPSIAGEAPYPVEPHTPERGEYFLAGYPDSASTATAMSTGKKTDSNNIAWKSGDLPGGELVTLPSYLRDRYGMAIGLVTTVPISHATPAAFFAHNVYRENYWEIGSEILGRTRPEVVIGGGVGPDRGNYVNADDLTQAAATGSWVVVERQTGVDGGESLLAASERAIAENKGLIGIFGGAGGNFESAVPSDTPGAPSVVRGSVENPSLADASVAALRVLARNPNGFFAAIEQGDIDWANHSNLFWPMIGCVVDLHRAVEAVVDFVDEPGDDVTWSNTTLLVTADHANSLMRFEKALGPGDLPAFDEAALDWADRYPDHEITYGTTTHTSELVTLRVRGRAAPRVKDYMTQFPGLEIVDDTAIHALTLDTVER